VWQSDRMMEIAIILYLIGLVWFTQVIEHEGGRSLPVLFIGMIWPAFVLYVLLFGFDNEED